MPDLHAACAAGDQAILHGRRYAHQWDPYDECDEELDFGWIGEDVRGVWLALHPTLALAQAPIVWDVWSDWQDGQRAVTPGRTLIESDALRVMIAAWDREQVRRSKRNGQD